MKSTGLMLSMVAACLLAGCAKQYPPLEAGLRANPEYSHNARSGRSTQFYDAYSVNEACQPQPGVSIRIVSPPQHGTASIIATRGHPSFPVTNPRRKCNRLRLPVMAAIYRSNPGYVGTDVVKLHTNFPSDGQPDDITATLKVR